MANKPIPSPDELRQLLAYDPETGKLFWKERGPEWFRDTDGRTAQHACRNWNARYAGQEAFTPKDAHGYRIGAIKDVKYKAHRVIWALVHGAWPVGDVDHVNMDRADNRIANLREADRSQNMRNRGATRRNSTGLKGVCWDGEKKKWLAQIKLDGRNKYLGRYDTPEEAHAAYVKAATREHGEFARTR